MLGFITPIVHLILTKPLGGVIFPVADKATDGGLDREILQPGRSSMQRLEAETRLWFLPSRSSQSNGGGRQPTAHCRNMGSPRKEGTRPSPERCSAQGGGLSWVRGRTQPAGGDRGSAKANTERCAEPGAGREMRASAA